MEPDPDKQLYIAIIITLSVILFVVLFPGEAEPPSRNEQPEPHWMNDIR